MPPSAQQRRADTQVSRAVRDRLLEITAHPGRNHARHGVALADRVGDRCQSSKRPTGVGTQWRHGHYPRQFETRVTGDGLGNRADLLLPGARSTRPVRLVEVDLDETSDNCLLCSAAECIDQAQPIHRMNQIRVPDDGSALVRLQRTDEVPSQNARIRAQSRHVGNLGSGFLIAVLADVSDAKFCKQDNV
jgi:hypothetical protein